MFRLTPLLLLAPLLAVAQTPPEPAVHTLKEAYELALKNSDSVAIGEESIRQAEALYRAAFGNSLPALTVRNDTTWQDKRAPATQSDGAARVQWTGLTGYRELAAVRASKDTITQRENLRRRAEQLLLGDVATAYYGLIEAQENASATQGLIEFADKRLVELKDRVRVGRAREADALSQEVQSASLHSQLEESSRQVQARGDLLAFFLRAPVQPQAPAADAPSQPPAIDSYLARVESRPDVAAARDAVKIADEAVDVARADYFPALTAQANYYGYRPQIRENSKWDALASVSLPIFSFGSTRASVAAAKAALSVQDLTLRAARRAAELDVRNAHRDFSSAVRQLEIQRHSDTLAHRDYKLQTDDERRGLVTSIEVLQSLDRLNIANLALNNALVQTRLASLTLELAAGAMPEEILK